MSFSGVLVLQRKKIGNRRAEQETESMKNYLHFLDIL